MIIDYEVNKGVSLGHIIRILEKSVTYFFWFKNKKNRHYETKMKKDTFISQSFKKLDILLLQKYF